MKTILVTGASGSIGRSICQTLTKEGYRVIGTYLTKNNSVVQRTKQNIVSSWRRVNLGDRNSIANFCESMRTTPLYGIINCAGIYVAETPKTVMQSWDQVIAINLTAPLLLSTLLEDVLEPNGSIINIGSVWGSVYGGKEALSYAISKAGLESLTKTLAYMYRDKKIRVNLVAPSAVVSRLSNQNRVATLNKLVSRTVLSRLGKPEEVASTVSFLLSGQASYITGTTILVDGGTTC